MSLSCRVGGFQLGAMIPRCCPSLLVIIAVLCSGRLFAQLPAAAMAAEPWAGKYSGPTLELELKPAPSGALTGVITFEKKVYTATATADGDKLTGTFRAGNDTFPYEATRNGNDLRFVTGGTEYRLRRASAPAAKAPNPLAGRASSTASPSQPSASPGQLVQVSAGYSFRLPSGWTSKENAEGVMFLPPGVNFDPERNDNAEVYLVALRTDYDPSGEADDVQQLSTAVSRSGGHGGQREVMKFGPRPGASYHWEFRDLQSGMLMAFDIHLAIEGRRVFVVIAAGEKTRVRGNEPAVHQILSSMAFTAPTNDVRAARAEPPVRAASGPLADSTPLAQRWLAKLRGKLVRQFWASQGMSSDKRHWLNADGTYAFKSSSMVSVSVPGAGGLSTGRDDSTGRWSIRENSGQVFLEIRYDNGNVARMRITEDNRNWYLNGEKAFAVNPE
jgi:hypothetical protein